MVNDSATQRRRGIYLLPNLFTTAALFAGFYAIVSAMGGRFGDAAAAIFVAMIFDGADGRIARMTNTESAFGAEYDSLSDVISFGLAPALVLYVWSLSALGKVGWLGAFFYAAATALRLARFNTQLGTADKRYFQGLPSPPAAAVVAGLVWVGADYDLSGAALSWLGVLLAVSLGALMVSNIRFRSFKEFDLRGRVPFIAVLAVVLGFAFVSLDPALVLFCCFTAYALSGPISAAHRLWLRRSRNPPRLAKGALRESDRGAAVEPNASTQSDNPPKKESADDSEVERDAGPRESQ